MYSVTAFICKIQKGQYKEETSGVWAVGENGTGDWGGVMKVFQNWSVLHNSANLLNIIVHLKVCTVYLSRT